MTKYSQTEKEKIHLLYLHDLLQSRFLLLLRAGVGAGVFPLGGR